MTTVLLPAGYADLRDRPALMSRLHAIDTSLQVDHIVDGRAICTSGELSSEPLPETWQLARGTTRAQGAMLAEVARTQGKTLVRFDPAAGFAAVARVAPAVVKLRDAIAPHVGCADHPWDVAITVRWATPTVGQPAHVSQVHVHRAGAPVLDRGKRLQLWRQIAQTVISPVQGTSWLIEDRPDTGEIILRRQPDPLATGFTLDEFDVKFREQNPDPSTSWKAFPIAVREDGSVVPYALFHTLIVGQTGAGKGSVLWSIMSGLLPSARAGLVEIFAIDPKNAEAKTAPGLFERVAREADEWDVMLEDLVDDLKARQAKSGRSFEPTRETPLRLLFIDELSALSVFDSDSQRAKRVQQNLMILLSQGRSDGNIVLAAVQAPQKEMVGQTRMFFAMRVALRTETADETNLVLGAGASEEGAAAHLITPANPGNGYATAGVGFMRLEGEALPVRVRFPYTDDATLHAWSAEFAALRAERRKTATEAVTDVGEVAIDWSSWSNEEEAPDAGDE